MNKTVVLAEKPDQAKQYVKALGKVKNKTRAYIEVDSEIFEGKTIVTWGLGHLISLSKPMKYEGISKTWGYHNLPITPALESMKYEVSEGKEYQFNEVKKQLESADTIIIATDIDPEGENIAYLILNQCSDQVWEKDIKRLRPNTLNPKKLKDFFKDLKNPEDYYKDYLQANARQVADWLVGMNFTELMTVKGQEAGLKGLYSIGRVRTPTLNLVCENFLKIKNFKPEPYVILEGLHEEKDHKVKFAHSKKYFDKEELKNDVEKYNLKGLKEAQVLSVEKTEKSKEPPKLFDLSGIQTYAEKKHGWSLDKTASMADSLRLKGYLSYIRTEIDLITTSEFEQLKENLEGYKHLLNVQFDNDHLEPRKRFVDNNKVKEHHAIIPTEELPNFEEMTEDEKTLYTAIAKNSILMFAPDYVYESTKVIVSANGLEFEVTGIIPKSLGWKKIETEDTEEEAEEESSNKLFDYQEGQTIPFKISMNQKETKPEKQLTEAGLGGKTGLMKKLGIGTPATRTNIVKELINEGSIEVEKSKLKPTVKGLLLWEMTRDLEVGKVNLTRTWEESLEKISTGEIEQEAFINETHTFVESLIETFKDTTLNGKLVQQVAQQYTDTIGNYSVELIKGKNGTFYSIKDKESNEQLFTLSEVFLGKKITKTILKELLVNGKTKSKVKGFKSTKKKDKDGKPVKYDAFLSLENNKYKLNFK